jgi:hypothetical protein
MIMPNNQLQPNSGQFVLYQDDNGITNVGESAENATCRNCRIVGNGRIVVMNSGFIERKYTTNTQI